MEIITILLAIVIITIAIIGSHKREKFSFFKKEKQLEINWLNDQIFNLQKRKEDLENKIEKQSQELEEKTVSLSTLWESVKKENEQAQKLRQLNEELNEKRQYYIDEIIKAYLKVEDDYDIKVASLEKDFQQKQQSNAEALLKESEELEKMRRTRAAAMEAARKEKEIKEKANDYCIQLTELEKADITKLESIRPSLNVPRVLNMLIWTSFIRDKMKNMSLKVLGSNSVTGIYKITNQITGECYIGQSVDLAKRWSDHAKCGLGIDTPPGNKLYKAMQEYGIWNFTWELLEECPRSQLDEKELFYISLYDSVNWGYNSQSGNRRK